MRRILPFVLAVAGCAATPRPVHEYSASYDLDATSMVQVVTDASAAHNYRVALIEPGTTHARMVILPTGNLERAALTVHLDAQSAWHDTFATCMGSCSTTVQITPASGGSADEAVALLEEIRARAQTSRMFR